MQILRTTDFAAYRRASSMGRKKTIGLIKAKGLSGRGGVGFSTGLKWEEVSQQPGGEKYLICNADEGEPGSFKDRFIIENNPLLVIEGILIAAYAVNAKKAFIYLRGEYDYLERKLKKAIQEAIRKTGSDLEITILVGAGAYICGEETAIISSMQGERGQARARPPYPCSSGLFGKPTLINNVETLANAPLALLGGWDPSLRLYSLSGDVSKPGVYELPVGTSLKKLVEMGVPKNKIKAVYFGCFGGCMPYKDTPLTENVCGSDCMLGACTVIVVDETKSIVDMATNISKFYEFESCGKCTPCREGTMRILALLENISMKNTKMEDLETLQELAEVISETSSCQLGQTSTKHLLTALKHFRPEFEERAREQKNRRLR
jgi:NADH:ubiquinone oxidoreductase subunit F (NADH-binding)